MYLEELVIDGFKSYSSRTVIPGWDPAFNAITGLNGSGKSNILDAICFVLGISTLSHVRAANLQDLVYKRGQAGVIRASVSITFNNEDKDRSPIGYQEHDHINITRSIVINGRNKTKVNGVDKSQQDVASLFQSVQLNVNNPHFLIMQGKITKVLNMKPPEILAMVEEAAGTRMFEDHKDKAIKTIDKKDSKLSEITSLLETEIAPKLDKLREGKRALLEYQKVDVDLSLVKRFVVAYDYYHAKQRAEKTSESLAYSQERIAHLEKLNAHEAENIGLIEESLRQCHADKAKNGGKSVQLEAEVKSIADDLVKVSTQHNLALESVKDEKKNRLALQESLAENQAAVVASRKKEEKLADKFQSTIVQNDELVVNVRKLEELLQTLTTGLSSSHGKDSGYLDQLRESKEQLSSATSEAQQIQLRMAHLSKELQDAEPKARAAEKQNVGLVHDLEANTKVLALLNDQMAAVAFDAAEEARLLDARRSEMEQLDAVDQAIRELQSSQSGFQFTYSDPTPNFDRSKVKGLVAELFDISADRMDASTALEVCAGGRLYNVRVCGCGWMDGWMREWVVVERH
ncbi:RecF/RecN/SMC N terminal domain-containing protein [Entophlyctis helioformis]|nr:RecF/RecN/SMC N terminal domain-containing protein [Entophlyctis helioformis]